MLNNSKQSEGLQILQGVKYVFKEVKQPLTKYAVDYLMVSRIVIIYKRISAYDRDTCKIIIRR